MQVGGVLYMEIVCDFAPKTPLPRAIYVKSREN